MLNLYRRSLWRRVGGNHPTINYFDLCCCTCGCAREANKTRNNFNPRLIKCRVGEAYLTKSKIEWISGKKKRGLLRSQGARLGWLSQEKKNVNPFSFPFHSYICKKKLIPTASTINIHPIIQVGLLTQRSLSFFSFCDNTPG